jgi:hypothetical protein
MQFIGVVICIAALWTLNAKVLVDNLYKGKTMSHEFLGLEDTLDEDDYALIVSQDGTLRGIWIPSGGEDDEVPDAITDVIKHFWDIDANDQTSYGTIH